MSNMSSWDDLPATSTINPFLYTCILNADYRALEQHLGNHTVQQSDLDGCLLYGLQFVQKKERTLSNVSPAIAILQDWYEIL